MYLSISSELDVNRAHSPIFDCSFDYLGGLRVDPDVPGAVNHAVELDRLRELGERLGRLVCEDSLDFGHFVFCERK